MYPFVMAIGLLLACHLHFAGFIGRKRDKVIGGAVSKVSSDYSCHRLGISCVLLAET